jgi:hypothetical protein
MLLSAHDSILYFLRYVPWVSIDIDIHIPMAIIVTVHMMRIGRIPIMIVPMRLCMGVCTRIRMMHMLHSKPIMPVGVHHCIRVAIEIDFIIVVLRVPYLIPILALVFMLVYGHMYFWMCIMRRSMAVTVLMAVSMSLCRRAMRYGSVVMGTDPQIL